MRAVAVDLGGTNVRFAIAELDGKSVVRLGPATTLHTGSYASLPDAWAAFAAQTGAALPPAAGIAVASPIHGGELKLTNSPWIIRPASLARELGVQLLTLVNDFGAVGHAVAHLPADQLRHIAGPSVALPEHGAISIVGPGTGLGVACVLRASGAYFVTETEGGHADFAPIDELEDAILARLRAVFTRVSAERIISGPGLSHIHDYLASRDGRPRAALSNIELWQAALGATDDLAVQALERFCLCLGSFCGDIVLAQGGKALVIGGGVGARLADMLPGSGFASRFTAKGRMKPVLASVPVKLIIHPEPGLFGAAAAFAQEHC